MKSFKINLIQLNIFAKIARMKYKIVKKIHVLIQIIKEVRHFVLSVLMVNCYKPINSNVWIIAFQQVIFKI